jgi:hypothetical protein
MGGLAKICHLYCQIPNGYFSRESKVITIFTTQMGQAVQISSFF